MSNSTTPHINGWIKSPNARGTGDIIWSCFFAVLVCTWTVLHLNLPAESENGWRLKLRKMKWMTIAIVMPEVVTCSAFVQRVAARDSVRSMGQRGCAWTLSRAFYFDMGGVWLKPRMSDPFPINAAQLEYLITKEVLPCPTLTEREIWDRSKADKFAKTFAVLQIFWLAIQSAARGAQKMPVTPLEIATLGFMIPSLASFVLWWKKPVDIEVPTMIPIDLSTQKLLEKLSPATYNWQETPLDFISKANSPSFTFELILKNRYWPGRHRFLGPAKRVRNDLFGLKYSKLDQLVVLSVWIRYAGTHFSAWNFGFPTRIELLWWRVSCLVMTGSMVIFWITSNRKFYLLFAFLPGMDGEKMKKVAYEKRRVSGIQIFTGVFGALAYLIARLSLIALAFSSLRSLPGKAFDTVDWWAYWPHFS